LKLKLISSEQVWRPLTRILPDGHLIFSGGEVDEGGWRRRGGRQNWAKPRAAATRTSGNIADLVGHG
jgi:hypothetical protein